MIGRLIRRRIVKTAVALLVVGGLTAVAVNGIVMAAGRGKIQEQATALPDAEAAIVLGALVKPDGEMSAMLTDRVRQAVALWKAKKVDRIIVSGDHGRWEYNEPDAMMKALRSAGVPNRAIFTDHAGFNTWATMVRARKVFGVRKAIVVTQGFHMARAIYLAQSAGLEVDGLTADLRDYGSQQSRSELREWPARLKAFAQATSKADVLLGPVIPISGDGRASRGPERPGK